MHGTTWRARGAGVLLAGFASGAVADSGIVVQQPWARATPGSSRTTAVYLTLEDGAGTDLLTGVTSPVAGGAMLHESFEQDGISKMRMLEAVALPQGRAVSFAPGGKHIMLTDLHAPLHAGESFPLTLQFAHAAPMTVTVRVLPVGATAPDAAAGKAPMPGMDMPGMEGGKAQ